jgi:hypothetical protein
MVQMYRLQDGDGQERPSSTLVLDRLGQGKRCPY